MDPPGRQKKLLLLLALLLVVLAFQIPSLLTHLRARRIAVAFAANFSQHQLAQKLIQEGKDEKAEQICLTVLKSDPANFRCYIDLGNLYTAQGNYIRAEQAYWAGLRCYGINPHNQSVIHYNLGGICERERNPGEAWAHMRKAYEMKEHLLHADLWSDNPSYESYRAAHGDRAGYMQWILDEEDKLPEEVFRRSQRLNKSLDQGDYLGALADSSQYVLLNPGSRFSYLFEGYKASALIRMGELDKAIEILQGLEHQYLPKDTVPWVQHILGYCLIAQGKSEEGVRYLYRITQEHPDYPQMDQVYFLASIAVEQKFRAAANDVLQKLLKKRPLQKEEQPG